MTRVHFDNGVVLWRRSLVFKLVWAIVIAAWVIAVVAVDGLTLEDRAVFLLLAAGWAGFGWSRVWRPHMAATADGLIVRRGFSAVIVPWSDIVGVSRPTVGGIIVRLRDGSIVLSAVPAKGPIETMLDLDSEADEAAAFIEARARQAAQPLAEP